MLENDWAYALSHVLHAIVVTSLPALSSAI